MKFNQKEEKAIKVLENILEAIKKPKKHPLIITEGECSALNTVLGWDLKQATTNKGDLIKMVRGKDELLVEISGRLSAGGSFYRCCYFPFQVKEKKKKGVKNG